MASSPPSYKESPKNSPRRDTKYKPISDQAINKIHIFTDSEITAYEKNLKLANKVSYWTWDRETCQLWIVAVLKHKCQREANDWWLKATAIMDGGYGPTLYTLQLKTWIVHLAKKDGHVIWALLVSLWNRRGAVPRSVRITHPIGAEVCAMKD